jgi:hypothetical protein
MARPIRLAPPVTSAAPRLSGVSVNPMELEIVDGPEHDDETDDDGESQHGKTPVHAGQ